MATEEGKILVRDVEPGDTNFVYDSWFRSWRNCKYAGVIPNNLYFKLMGQVVENLVARGARILVATVANRLLGFICFEFTGDGKPVVHYIYVKDPYFKFGVGELLRDEAFPGLLEPGFITFKSPIVLKYFDDFKHAPEIARRKDV
jgi:hypothetical protein